MNDFEHQDDTILILVYIITINFSLILYLNIVNKIHSNQLKISAMSSL